MSWPVAFVIAAIVLFRAAVLGTCAYAVFWLGCSGWWFLLALIICSARDEYDHERGKQE